MNSVDKEYVTGEYYAFDIDVVPPPINKDALFITKYGILQKSKYIPGWHIAWYPLPRMTQRTKDKMNERV